MMLSTVSEAQKIVGEEHYLHHKNKLLLDAGKLQESLEVINSIREGAMLTQNRIIPMSLARAYVHGQAGETEKMNQQHEAAEEMLKKMANENPIDERIQMALGAIHAMRGEKEAALMRGKQAVALYPLDKNKITAQRVHIDYAKIYLRLGMKDECIDVIERLRDKPLRMEVGDLKTVKVWEPVRSHPAYRVTID